ncbi:Altered inheritance of mitochondria protein 9, mitochondrial [Cytospora mali]|uniref:Altered inheritance of mitochondria protein 9, mitochondrial n=1 Tax=Cytospora mali TaxID=578113 RepID=A0A194UX23_CYTMA|nr:Altered inheritance of mitochondria protein 9, mitochondrial [Valsa mali var. pyri (nom. inval.)]
MDPHLGEWSPNGVTHDSPCLERDRDHGMFDDDEVVTSNQARSGEFIAHAMQTGLRYKLIDFVRRHRPGGGAARRLHRAIRGSYNINWRVEFDDGRSVMFHTPLPGSVAFPDEKIRAEVAAMEIIRAGTSIPVPEVYHWGMAADNPVGTGPFIIMEYIEHTSYLVDMIRDTTDESDNHGLRKGLSEERLLKAYRHMANIVLQLSTIESTVIGYPTLTGDDHNASSSSSSSSPSSSLSSSQSSPSWQVNTRPVSHNMNELVASGGLPPYLLPPKDKTYPTEKDWTSALADMHLTHLAFQRNDAVLGRPDARDKYVARQLFRRLAASGRLTKTTGGSAGGQGQDGEKFKLWCDDMRPASVLLDEDENVVGVIDWEMSYFAPASYTYDPPWWLCLAKPEYWKPGLGDFYEGFGRCVGVFLRALEMEEAAMSKRSRTGGGLGFESRLGAMRLDGNEVSEPSPFSLSARMRHNWESGSYFVNYAARKAWAFDSIYWKYIDPMYFGENREGGYEGRLGLFSESEKEQMERFIDRKVEELKDVRLVKWEPEDAKMLQRACLEGTLGQREIAKPRVIY